MYQSFYGLSDDPFRMSPCEEGCFAHPSFAKARSYILYMVQRAEGILVLTGSPGLGKTTLVRNSINQDEEENVSFVEISGDHLAADDFLFMVAYRFGLECHGLSKGRILATLERRLAQLSDSGRRAVLLIDEAQDLDVASLNEVKSLSNLEHRGKPLVQIFLIGQNSLLKTLHRPELEAVLQRVTAACQLEPMTREEVGEYLIHRLDACGWQGDPSIEASVSDIIFQHSGGVPRRINLIGSRLLLRGMINDSHELKELDVKMVLDELYREGLAIDAEQPQEQIAALKEAYR